MLNITKTATENRTVFALEGRLDTNTSTALERELAEFFDEGGTTLSLDLAKLGYISSMGLRVILAAQKRINKLEGGMMLLNVSQTIREVFDVTGFSGFLTIV